uniref:ATP synthase subunit a n=1 Tax=Capsaspora owczarzaki TaxID=192875 RepID=M1JZG9_9EUKA|nr:ATP synthase F0 subunit a [Capsaspora owczarzaki]
MITALLASPVEQFQVIPYFGLVTLGNVDFSYSNVVWVLLLLLLTLANISLLLGKRSNISESKVVQNNWQRMITKVGTFVNDMSQDTIGSEGRRYVNIILGLFVFVLLLNILGMIPYSFAITSQIVVTLWISWGVWLGSLTIGFINYGINFFSMFMPSGAPLALAPFLILIELLSYVARGISLGVRLAANITSGHILLTIIATFIFKMLNIGGIFIPLAFLTFALLFVLTILEMAIGAIQAYVLGLLVTIYLNDSVHLH